jgi:hypothetical protein
MLKLLISHAQLLMCAMHWVCALALLVLAIVWFQTRGRTAIKKSRTCTFMWLQGAGLGGLLPQA